MSDETPPPAPQPPTNPQPAPAPPAPDQTFGHVTCQSITVSDPKSAATVQLLASPYGTGIWVQSGRGNECVGICSDHDGQTYMVFWPPHAKMPDLAIGTDPSGHAFLQVAPETTSGPSDIKVIALDALVKLVADAKIPPAAQQSPEPSA